LATGEKKNYVDGGGYTLPKARYRYIDGAGYSLYKGFTGSSNTNEKINVQRSRHFLNFLKYRSENGPFRVVGDLPRNYPTIESPAQFHTHSHPGWQYTLARVFGETLSNGTFVEGFETRSEASYTETTGATASELNAKMNDYTALPDSVVLARENRRHEMRNAAIYCLHPDFVTNPTRIAIKQKLARCFLNTVRNDNLDITNTVHFPRGGFSDDASGFWQLCHILTCFIQIYDDLDVKISDDDFLPFSAAERTEIKDWFSGWYEMFDSLFRPQIVKAFPAYYTYSYSGAYGTVNRDDSPSPVWWQYNPDDATTPVIRNARGYQKFLNNRRGFYQCYALFYQAKFGLGSGRADAYRWIYHCLRFATWADGDFAEQHRISAGEPAEGLIYTGSSANQFTWMMDIAMKMGWSEIYTDFWVNGITAGYQNLGGENTASATPKTIKTIIKNLSEYAKNSLPFERYASLSGAQNRTSSLRIKLYNVENSSTNNFVVDVAAAAIASPLAKDQEIENIHLRRQAAGFYPFTSSDKVGGVNNMAKGFRALNANIMLEWGARGGAWHPEQNPCDYPTLMATAYA
jgi:hypothetical protein